MTSIVCIDFYTYKGHQKFSDQSGMFTFIDIRNFTK
jgi:hypothetical protein